MASPNSVPGKNQPPVERCNMSGCGQVMQVRQVPGDATLHTKPVLVYRCPTCDVRKCQRCKTRVLDIRRRSCPKCGINLLAKVA